MAAAPSLGGSIPNPWLVDVRWDVRTEPEPKRDTVNTKQGEEKKKKKNSYIIWPVFFNFALGHFLNSIYLYPYIFIYIYIFFLQLKTPWI